MESLPGYDNWKLDDGMSDTARCDCCGEEFDIEFLYDQAGVYVCYDCLEIDE